MGILRRYKENIWNTYARRLERIESLKAKERQATSTGGTNPQLMEIFPQAENGAVRDIVASKLGIGSGKQYEKEKYIVDNKDSLTPEDFSEWDEGKQNSSRICLSLCVRSMCGSYMRLVYTGKCVIPVLVEIHNGVVKCYPIETIF